MGKAEKEKRTREEYEQVRDKMAGDGYAEKVHTLSKLKVSVFGILIPVILTIIMGVLYRLQNGSTLDFVLDYPLLIVFVLIVIVVHEFLHGLAWSFSCKHGFRSITFSLSGFMPLCHCKEVLHCGKYLVGVIMPFLVLGVGLAVVSFLLANMWLLIVTAFNFFLTGGDLLIAFELRKAKKARIFDHPTEPGFIAFEKND